jgi:hypothetical protein
MSGGLLNQQPKVPTCTLPYLTSRCLRNCLERPAAVTARLGSDTTVCLAIGQALALHHFQSILLFLYQLENTSQDIETGVILTIFWLVGMK